MGRRLDALLGRSFKASKLKTVAKLAVSRIAILKNQRQTRYSHAKSDVAQLLILSRHQSALLRVELVIKDQNMMDALVLIEGYCHLLIQRDDRDLLQKNKGCHDGDAIKEAISSLIFASARCAEFPELQQIRRIFQSRLGKEFADSAVEIRNNCGVHPKIVQMLSTRQPSLESKMKVLKDIASENGIVLNPEEDVPEAKELKPYEKLSESTKAGTQYRDVAAAAQDAFESAAYAAAAARAAVELSRHESQNNDQDYQSFRQR